MAGKRTPAAAIRPRRTIGGTARALESRRVTRRQETAAIMEELGEILRGFGPKFGVVFLGLAILIAVVLVAMTLPRLLRGR